MHLSNSVIWPAEPAFRGTIETSSVAIEFAGHAVTGRVSGGRETDVDGNWQAPRLTIIIETV